jgi:type IV secretion system protein VirB11
MELHGSIDLDLARSSAFEAAMRPISNYYRRQDVEETILNRYGEVVLRTKANTWEFHDDSGVDEKSILRMLRLLANRSESKSYHPINCPLLYIDIGDYRFSAIHGRWATWKAGGSEQETANGIALCMRHQDGKKRDFSDWGLIKGKSIADLEGARVAKARKRYHPEPLTDLEETIKNGGGVLMVGGMGTGKTRLLMAIAELIPSDKRIGIVEDAREIRIPHHNRIHLMADRASDGSISWKQILDFLVRSTIDVPILGEVSATNAGVLWQMFNLGLSNLMTTVHGNSAADGVRSIYLRIAHSQPDLDWRFARETILNAFSRIIYLERDDDGLRGVNEYVVSYDLIEQMNDQFERDYNAARNKAA